MLLRERIACNKAIAVAKRSAKERTARNKAAAVAKRLVLARKPTWHITKTTNAHFGIGDGALSSVAAPSGSMPNISDKQPVISNRLRHYSSDDCLYVATNTAEPLGNELTRLMVPEGGQ